MAAPDRTDVAGSGQAEYRIDDLARVTGTSVRNVRAYQDRGLLHRPRRAGRIAVYDESHVVRLRIVGQLLDRGYTLGNIKELLAAWERGQTLGALLGLAGPAAQNDADAAPTYLTSSELLGLFRRETDIAALDHAVRFGLVEPDGNGFRVPLPGELSVSAQLHAAGVPLAAIVEQLAQMRADVRRLAERFVAFVAGNARNWRAEWATPGGRSQHPAEAEADGASAGGSEAGRSAETEPNGAVDRLAQLARRAVDAELARAIRDAVPRYLADSHAQPATQAAHHGPARGPFRFLSTAWLQAAADLVREVRLPISRTGPGVIVNVVILGPSERSRPVEFHLDTYAGRLTLRSGQLPDCDMLVRLDEETARHVMLGGDQHAVRAALAGDRLAIRGDLSALLRLRVVLAAVSTATMHDALRRLTIPHRDPRREVDRGGPPEQRR